jgi:hypothetical protein
MNPMTITPDEIIRRQIVRVLSDLADASAALRVAREAAYDASRVATMPGVKREAVLAAIGELTALVVAMDRVTAAQRRVDNEND